MKKCLAMLVVIVACAEPREPTLPPTPILRISPSAPNVVVGQAFVFDVDSTGGVGAIRWASSVPTVATVDSTGRALGANPGVSVIVASSSAHPELMDSAKVTVLGFVFETTNH